MDYLNEIQKGVRDIFDSNSVFVFDYIPCIPLSETGKHSTKEIAEAIESTYRTHFPENFPDLWEQETGIRKATRACFYLATIALSALAISNFQLMFKKTKVRKEGYLNLEGGPRLYEQG